MSGFFKFSMCVFRISEDFKGDIKKINSKNKVKKNSSNRITSDSKLFIKSKIKEEKSKAKCIPCDQCDRMFKSDCSLSKHQIAAHKHQTPYECPNCDQRYVDIDEMFTHVIKHSKSNVKCRFCEKDYDKRSLVKHENSVHLNSSNDNICDLCNKKFFNRSTLKKHKLWHEGLNKKVFCDICGNGFNDKTNLRIHIDAVHFRLRKYPCLDCDKTYTAKKHLRNHAASKHGATKPYSCKHCPATFCYWKGYYEHKRIHEGDGGKGIALYRCKGCPETFDNRGRFKAHVLQHNRDGSSPHICHVCGRGFTCKYSLNRHLDNHSGLKRFSCDICEQKFSQKGQVARHKRRLHDPVKQEKVDKIKCPICKISVRDIERHTKRHIDRPYACDMCDKTYPERNVLNRHRKETHLGIFKHGCSVCNKKFKSALLLAKHNEKIHKDLATEG